MRYYPGDERYEAVCAKLEFLRASRIFRVSKTPAICRAIRGMVKRKAFITEQDLQTLEQLIDQAESNVSCASKRLPKSTRSYSPGDLRYERAYKRLCRLKRRFTVTTICKKGGGDLYSRTFDALYRLNRRADGIGEIVLEDIENCLTIAENS